MNFEVVLASENAFILYFGDKIDPKISSEVQKSYQALKRVNIKGLQEIVPSYASLYIQYDLFLFTYQEALELVKATIQKATCKEQKEQKIIHLPVYYGKEVGLDLEDLARAKELSVEEIISLHVKEIYSVYAIGFAPGFTYMGQIDARLQTPRLANPRKNVPKGSVAIADRQTAIYPLKSPGGWNILGRTPKSMFDTTYEGLSFLHVGDLVKFESINKNEFLVLGGEL